MDNPAFDTELGDVRASGDVTGSQKSTDGLHEATDVTESNVNSSCLRSPPQEVHVSNPETQTTKAAVSEKEREALFPPINGSKKPTDLHGFDADLGKDGVKNPESDSTTSSDFSNSTDDDDLVCGFGPFRPTVLQRCMSMGYFTVFYSFAGIVTSALNVYMTSQITTLEKHFNFSSSFSGFLLSCNDLGYLATTLFMSYYTRRVHIPRALALSTVIFGLSGLMCTIAFFITRDNLPSPPNSAAEEEGAEMVAAGAGRKLFAQICDNVTSSANASCAQVASRTAATTSITASEKSIALFVLAAGMIIQGMAKSPRHPFLGTYVDDNVPKTKSTMYLGIMSGCSLLGPACAFTLGGLFSKIYVTLEDTDMSFRDPRWIGAWWLGFLLFGLAGLVVALPIFCFPRRLRPQQKEEEIDVGKNGHSLDIQSKDDKQIEEQKSKAIVVDMKGFFQCMRRLLTNPVYMLIVLATAVNLMAISGFISFSPKYLETQFTVPVWRANMVLGAVNVVAASFGTVLGGCLTTRLRLTPLACLRFLLASIAVSTSALTLSFVFGCDQPQIEIGQAHHSISSSFQSSTCVASCNCDSLNFFPVCGEDNRNYFSPCHAGCKAVKGSQTFTHCSCLLGGENFSSHNTTSMGGTAKAGLCGSECGNFFPYVASTFFMGLTGTVSIMPGFVVYVRSVLEKDKPLAIGFFAFVCTILGWFPGPVIFGYLVDTTCILWKNSCDSQGACSLYDLKNFRVKYHGLMIGLRTVTCLLILAALVIATFSKTFKFQAHLEDKNVMPPTPPGGGKKNDDGKGKKDTNEICSAEG